MAQMIYTQPQASFSGYPYEMQQFRPVFEANAVGQQPFVGAGNIEMAPNKHQMPINSVNLHLPGVHSTFAVDNVSTQKPIVQQGFASALHSFSPRKSESRRSFPTTVLQSDEAWTNLKHSLPRTIMQSEFSKTIPVDPSIADSQERGHSSSSKTSGAVAESYRENSLHQRNTSCSRLEKPFNVMENKCLHSEQRGDLCRKDSSFRKDENVAGRKRSYVETFGSDAPKLQFVPGAPQANLNSRPTTNAGQYLGSYDANLNPFLVQQLFGNKILPPPAHFAGFPQFPMMPHVSAGLFPTAEQLFSQTGFKFVGNPGMGKPGIPSKSKQRKSDCEHCKSIGAPSCGKYASKCPNRLCDFCGNRHRYMRCKLAKQNRKENKMSPL